MFTLAAVFVLGGACVLIALFLAWRTGTIGGSTDAIEEPRPATALLQAFQCRTSEHKEIILRGVEDAYDPSGDEPSALSQQAATTRNVSQISQNFFDNSQADNHFQDHALVPSRISSGLIVIRMRPIIDNENDRIQLGDRSEVRTYLNSSGYFVRFLPELEDAGWSRDGDVYSIAIGELRFTSLHRMGSEDVVEVTSRSGHASLLEYIRSGEGASSVDLSISDDTSVDFWGLAVCLEPETGAGVTYAVRPLGFGEAYTGMVWLSSDATPEQYFSNPYVGDTPCETELPLACFLDLNQAAPRQINALVDGDYPLRVWSGGTIAGTPAVAASRFETIDDADAYCEAEFGADWRVLTYHDGGIPGHALAYGSLADPDQRHWIDIRGQPYGTCWAHE